MPPVRFQAIPDGFTPPTRPRRSRIAQWSEGRADSVSQPRFLRIMEPFEDRMRPQTQAFFRRITQIAADSDSKPSPLNRHPPGSAPTALPSEATGLQICGQSPGSDFRISADQRRSAFPPRPIRRGKKPQRNPPEPGKIQPPSSGLGRTFSPFPQAMARNVTKCGTTPSGRPFPVSHQNRQKNFAYPAGQKRKHLHARALTSLLIAAPKLFRLGATHIILSDLRRRG